MLGGELWSMSPLVHPELVTGCLRASLHKVDSFCRSRPLVVFFTLEMPSRAPDSVTLHTHTGGGSHHFCDMKGHRGQVFFFLNRCVLTLRPSPRRLRPGAAAGRGCWTPVGTCSPSWRKRWEWTLPPRTVDTDRRRIEAFGEGREKRC